MTEKHMALAEQMSNRYSELLQVEAVAIAGSLVTGTADEISDIDLYIYTQSDVSTDERARIAGVADHAEIDNSYWGPGDEWRDKDTGIHVDVMFWSVPWIEEQLNRVLVHHLPSVGYSTAFWHTIRNSSALFDRNGWFHTLQQKANQPYPERLARSIITNNYPILRHNESAYLHQLEKAVERSDLVSVNHRVAELLASYFDIILAVNRTPHPGEKRLLYWTEKLCPKLPPDMRAQVTALLHATAQDTQQLIERVNMLVDSLDALLKAEGLYTHAD